jgi:glutamate-1-semialdehyde 2,1-aminomutase
MAVPLEPKAYGVTYVDHSIPAAAPLASCCRAWIRIENAGTLAWLRNPADGHPVNLGLWADGSPAQTIDLPAERVEPGESVTIPFEFQVPNAPGSYVIKCDLVHQNVTFFEEQGVQVFMVQSIAVSDGSASPFPHGQARKAPAVALYSARFTDHRIPSEAHPGVRFGIWLQIQNRGALTWEVNPARSRQVRLAIRMDGRVVAGADLPHPVRPFEQVDVHLAVPAPLKPGRHMLRADLVHEGVTFFEACGSETLAHDFQVTKGSQPEGASLFETALARDAWFYQPSFGVFSRRDGGSYPLFIKRARGCHVWDTEDRRYIDYTIGWGAALLGHAYPPIQQAVRLALDDGAILPLPHPLEMEVAQLLCEMIPCAEMVAFGKNGSDVCTLAVRLARLYTGRRMVLTCGYHGWQDWFVEARQFESTGVPSRPEPLTDHFAFNDLSDFESKLMQHKHDLAAVMLEPAGASQAGQVPAEDVDYEFLRFVADQTRRAGGLLIFDEIITGFRYPGGGLQEATGVAPELACFGKALGAGMPISALVGRSDIFRRCMPNAYYGPTYKGEVYSLAAAKAALEIYRSQPVAEHVWKYGRKLKTKVNQICRERSFKAKLAGAPFRFGLAIDESDPLRLRLMRAFYLQEMLKEGIITYNGAMLPSFAHDEQTMHYTVAAIDVALQRLDRSSRNGTLHQDLELPLPGP